jgi:GWxTD domain-containing protein
MPEWREGPVRYIITKGEDKEYLQLDTEEDRRRAIDAFWRRRDPTPDTPGNEYRAKFWRRVKQANRLYGRETTRPGWVTDMGKIHILFGPPDEISRDEMAQGRRGIIVWTYRNTPSVGDKPDFLTGPNQVFAFAQDGTSEYRLTVEPSKVADVWEGLPDPQPPMGLQKTLEARRLVLQQAMASYIGLTDPVIRAHGGPATGTPLSLSMTQARMQQPPKKWELTGEIATREFFGSLPFRARADFFKTTGEEALVLISVALKSSAVTYRSSGLGEEPAVQIYARILDSTESELIRSLERDTDFVPARENLSAALGDDLVFQARAPLPPGSYVARLTVLDEMSGRSSASDTPFTVPDFGSDRLQLSTVTLARVIEPAGDQAVSDWPFTFGALRVVPRLAHTYVTGEELAFYYQVYGAVEEPATGLPDLDVAYAFLVAEGEELQEFGRIVFEDQETEAHGYSLPLEGWPPGHYIIRVEVIDKTSSLETSREFVFRVIEAR